MATLLDPSYFQSLLESIKLDEVANAAELSRVESDGKKIKEKKFLLENALAMAYGDVKNKASELNSIATHKDIATSKKHVLGLQLQTLNLITEGENVKVKDVFDRVKLAGIETTKGSINTSLSILTKKGLLEKASLGVYRKPQKAEKPSVSSTGVSIVQPSSLDGTI
jgi:hypothetical protein